METQTHLFFDTIQLRTQTEKPLPTNPLKMTNVLAESAWDNNNFGQFLHSLSFHP